MNTQALACAAGIAAIILTGCGKSATERTVEQAIEKETGGKANVDIGSNGAVRVETDQGTFATGQGLPENWPEDVVAYPGATVQYSGAINPAGGQEGSLATFTTKDAAKTVQDFYTAKLADQGWMIQGTMQNAGATVVIAKKDDRILSLTVAPTDDQTTITIGVGKE